METLIYHIENGGSTWQEKTVDVSSPIKIMNIKINKVLILLSHLTKHNIIMFEAKENR